MSNRTGKLLVIALAVGGGYLALNRGAPPLPAPKDPPAASQPAQDAPIPPPPLPEPRPVPKNEPSPPPPVAGQGSKAVPAAKSPAAKAKAGRKDKAAVPKTSTNVGQTAKTTTKQVRQKQRAGSSYCDNLRRRMAQTPTRVFSCAEMKAARSCERPGDRAKATWAQIAEGTRCAAAGEL